MYIDIHTHTAYSLPETTLVVNVFPEQEKPAGESVWLSVGLHPWHIQHDWKEKLASIEQAINTDPRIIAIGETGLDKATSIPYDLQEAVFEKHIEIASAAAKPMIIHCVRSYSEMMAYRKKALHESPWIFHWFNSTLQVATGLITKNCYLSFGHMLFKKESKAFEVFQHIPLQNVFLETDDAGFSIYKIYEQAARIRHINPEVLKEHIMDNFERCFK